MYQLSNKIELNSMLQMFSSTLRLTALKTSQTLVTHHNPILLTKVLLYSRKSINNTNDSFNKQIHHRQVFTNKRGGPLSPYNFRYLFTKWGKAPFISKTTIVVFAQMIKKILLRDPRDSIRFSDETILVLGHYPICTSIYSVIRASFPYTLER